MSMSQTDRSAPELEKAIRARLGRRDEWRRLEQSRLISMLDLAASALGYIAEANTLPAAQSTARGALLGIAKEIGP